MVISNKQSGNYRPNTELEILENPMAWVQDFQNGWLNHLENTGLYDWGKYTPPRNAHSPSGDKIKLSDSRIMLISSAGVYLKDTQKGFNIDHPTGDYTIREIPINSPFENLIFSHKFVDLQYLEADPQVIFPQSHLIDLANEGLLGEIAPVSISFNGFQPDLIRVVKELIPTILKIAEKYKINGVIIIPAGKICLPSVGLVARALELNGVAATQTSWDENHSLITAPPRLCATQLKEGCPLGKPFDNAQQRRVLEATLRLLESDAPLKVSRLNETL